MSLSINPKMIMVVEDEIDILELIILQLKSAGFKAKGYSDICTFNRDLFKVNPDLILLDWMLPDGDGVDVCKSLRSDREFKNIPIMMITAKGEEIDRILGLELGADDYLCKPFSPREMLARVNGLLRRSGGGETDLAKVLHLGKDVVLDLEKYEVFRRGRRVDLTTTEFKVLKLMVDRPGVVFSREQILNHIWDEDKPVLDRTVDVHIKNLREKLMGSGQMIKSVRGIGYKVSL